MIARHGLRVWRSWLGSDRCSDWTLLPQLAVIHPHIVHDHLLWKCHRAVRIAGPVTAHCEVQDDEEGLLERAGIVDPVLYVSFEILVAIDVPTYRCRIPFDGIQVELRGVDITRRHTILNVCSSCIGPMYGAMDDGLAIDMFHDVDFAALGPSNLVDIRA